MRRKKRRGYRNYNTTIARQPAIVSADIDRMESTANTLHAIADWMERLCRMLRGGWFDQ